MERKTTAGLIAIVVIASVLIFSGCVEEKIEPGSFVTEPKPQLEAELLGCSYKINEEYPNLDGFELYFRITNVGNIPTRVPSQIWLIPENGTGGGRTAQRAYGKGEIVLEEEFPYLNYPWHIHGTNGQNVKYTLVYTEFESGAPLGWKIPKGGLILYSGNTRTDCSRS